MDSVAREEERIRNLFDSVESDEELIPGDSSDTENDLLNESVHNTDTEQECEGDSESENQDDMPLAQRLATYTAKDGSKWSKYPPPQNVRTRARNIVNIHLPTVKMAAKQANTPLDAWLSMIDDSIIDDIVTCTNIYISSVSGQYVRDRDANLTNSDELKALFGLLYFAGVMKSNNLNTKELWNTNGSGIELFPATMGINRFHFLLRCIRFDNIHTRDERKKVDKLAPIRNIFERIVKNFQNGFSPSEYVTVDEKLEPFRGKCPFRQYIKSKPAKYGIKIFGLADSRWFYTCNMEIYAGEQPEGPYRISNAAADVVKRLVTPISGTGRNIFCDNWFMSVPLAKDLLKDHNLTCTGTIRLNKRELPQELTEKRGREKYSSLFAFSKDMTITSYIPKPGRVVIVASTMHHDNKIDPDTGVEKKPVMITDYNLHKGGIDVVDKLCGTYTVSRKCKRWPLTVFFGMLNVSGINALVIYKNNIGVENRVERRVFLKDLGLQLCKAHIASRLSLHSLPIHLKTSIKRIAGVEDEPKKKKEKRVSGRCEVCPTRKDRKTHSSCCKCNKLICREHSVVCCEECAPH